MHAASAPARMVLAIGGPSFADRLLDAAGACLAHDAAALMIFHPAAPPAVRRKYALRGALRLDLKPL